MKEKRQVTLIYSKTKSPLMSVKVGRNELCPCKSGKKSKNCCGNETKYFTKPK